ncbi:hypothetical protein [Nocardioides speluncae]|uniref:hypothetical protein n=1 Tax=Nocardioides speluncae TaxID=2670337 RepID=UPI000D6A0303|nr:hypothetical protein [Nocardioides speluncae]
MSRLRSPIALLVALGVLAGAVSGCGKDAQEAYCDEVKASQEELGKITGDGGADALLRALPILEELGEQAPSDIKDEWKILLSRVQAFEKAVDETGVDPATYDPKEPPKDLTAAEKTRLEEAASDLLASDTQEASQAVTQHSLDVCKTPISL